MKQTYDRVVRLVDSLSRAESAVLIGVLTTVGYLLLGGLLRTDYLIGTAITLGVANSLINYYVNGYIRSTG